MSVLGRTSSTLIYFGFAVLWLIFSTAVVSVYADSKSSNYELIEPSVGGNGLMNSSSKSYQAQESGGIIGIGTSATSGGPQVQAGHETTNDPALSFQIINGNVAFGSFSPTATATTTSSFSITNYTSYGYIVQVFGTPPTNAYGHQITPMANNGASQVGTEQYGINLAANTQPTTFGANPNYGQFGNGSVATNYKTPNSYRFVSGDTIANAGKSSGKTIYTISYIVNVSSITPGGQYTATQNIVCTGTY